MIPQLCPFCSFLHPPLGPPLHCSPNLSLPKRHRKSCIVCPAAKDNAETFKWLPRPQSTPSHPAPPNPGGPGILGLPKKLCHLAPRWPRKHAPLCFRGGRAGGAPGLSPGLEASQAPQVETSDLGQTCQSPVQQGWVRDCSVPCVIVLLKDYLVLVFIVSTGATAWGQGWKGLPVFYQRCYIYVRGGWGGNHWCYRS